MFTVCPGCTKQFRLYAEQIAAASGQVRCGFCNTQFNALEHLYDEPLSNDKIPSTIHPEPIPEPELVIEPDFDIPEEDEIDLPIPDNGLLNTIDESNSENAIDVDSPAIAVETNEHEESVAEQDVIITNQATNSDLELNTAINEIGADTPKEDLENLGKKAVTTEVGETHYDFPDAEELLSETPVKRRWIATFFWTSASITALVVLTLQLAWFNRDQLLMKYPQLKPYAKQLCNELDCRLIRQRDARAIKLVNRDVRLHPTYQDTLLVNATMNNELAVRQPYPRVQLTLFDTSGALMSYRQFTPDDYLDDSIDLDQGMPVNVPVHFVLEVSGPTAGAVSFEFRFL